MQGPAAGCFWKVLSLISRLYASPSDSLSSVLFARRLVGCQPGPAAPEALCDPHTVVRVFLKLSGSEDRG